MVWVAQIFKFWVANPPPLYNTRPFIRLCRSLHRLRLFLCLKFS